MNLKKKLLSLAAALVILAAAYLLLSFTAWSFDFREWNWILRLVLALIVFAQTQGLVKSPFKTVT